MANTFWISAAVDTVLTLLNRDTKKLDNVKEMKVAFVENPREVLENTLRRKRYATSI